MKIQKATKFISSHRTAHLEPITHEEITKVLGFEAGDGDFDKVKREWQFTVDGVECAIWDYKGSDMFKSYSCYMPAVIGKAIFGERFHDECGYRKL